MNTMKKISALLLCLVLTAVQLISAAALADANTRVIVSLGDSYSSGEGVEAFYGQDEDMSVKCGNPDWLAHRSEKAWAGMLTIPGVEGPMSAHRGENWFFVAASGAETDHLFRLTEGETQRGKTAQQQKKFNRNGISGTAMLAPQLDIFDELDAKGLKADYVTLTIGGNDMKFAENIALAFVGVYGLAPGSIETKVDLLWKTLYEGNGLRNRIKRAFTDIADRAGDQAWIIVAGYPKLLNPDGGDIGFPAEDAKFVNAAVVRFNNEIRDIVDECRAEGMKICFVSVTEAFENHGAYADDPYINPVILSSQAQDLNSRLPFSLYSMHPNEKGCRAYADCVQAVIDRLERERMAAAGEQDLQGTW